ncbi:unnamed protein product [Trichobilharzia regenti]|nr:unnamed protein product [Trichobilharzia regenti]
MPWCSSRSIVWQRTEASIGVDDIDPSSIETIDETDMNATTNGEQQLSKFTVIRLKWLPPSTPNGLTLHYWLRYRRLKRSETKFDKQSLQNSLSDVSYFFLLLRKYCYYFL